MEGAVSMRRYPRQQEIDWRRFTVKTPRGFGGFGGWRTALTTLLLTSVLVVGPLLLGGVRWWGGLPLLGGVALLLLLQAIRLLVPSPDAGTRRTDVIDFTVVFFVAYTIVRWLFSPANSFTRVEALDVVAYAGVFLTCRYGMDNRPGCVAFLFALVALGLGETAFGYVLSYHSDPTDAASQWFCSVRPSGRSSISFRVGLAPTGRPITTRRSWSWPSVRRWHWAVFRSSPGRCGSSSFMPP